MVTVLGNATTGYATPATTTGLPKPADRVAAHKPWCRDCKRKHEPADLDDNDRCEKCARAAVTRAAAEQARAERAEEIAALEKAAAAEVKARARDQHAVVRRASDQVAKRATPRAAKPAPAPAPKPAETPKPAATTPRAETPRPARATPAQNLDAQLEHTSRLLRATATNTHPLVVTARRAAVAAIEALHLAHELHGTPRPARSAASSPAAEPAPKTSAGPREGEAPARRTDSKFTPYRDDLIRRYNAGESAGDLIASLPIEATREGVIYYLRGQGVTIRPRGGRKSSQHTTTTGAATA